MDTINLGRVPNGYDLDSTIERILRLTRLVAEVKEGRLPQADAVQQADILIATPLPLSEMGADPQKADECIEKYRMELESYKLTVYSRLKRARNGYSAEEFDAKISAYNKLIHDLRNGLDNSLAMAELERIRQMPLPEAKKDCSPSTAMTLRLRTASFQI